MSAAAEHLLAIDVGTQSARALVFDPDGHLLAKAQRFFDPPFLSPEPGWAEQDAETYWSAITAACHELWAVGPVRPEEIAGLSLTTLRGTPVCANEDGSARAPALIWLDQRRADVLPQLGGLWNAAFKLGGASDLIAHAQRECEANWFAQHRAEFWRETPRYVLLSGWLTRRLVGEWVDSAGCQVGYLPFDYKRLAWAAPSDFKWRAFAVRPRQCPRLVSPGQLLGALTHDAATALGLPEGLRVVAAAADKACEVLGSGAARPDTAHLSFGTSATINTTQVRYMEVQRLLPAYPAAMPGCWLTEIQIYRGFWMVSWFKREFAHREVELAAGRGVPVESLFEDLITRIPAGSMGLTLQPYWSPGVRDPGPEAKGAVIGFGDIHTRAHLYRAILEGLAYSLRAGRDTIERKLKAPITQVIASGGGSQSDAAMQITADVFGQRVERPEVYESSGLGAAINLSVGLGLHPDHRTAVAAMTRIGRVFEPEPEAVRIYDQLYHEVYRELYPRLRPLYKCIRAITGYPA